MRIAIYPGTFDPITYGHIDVIKKSLNVFDKLIVATTDNINKNYHFSIEDRLSIINNSLFNDLKLNKNKIKVVAFDNLTIDLYRVSRSHGANRPSMNGLWPFHYMMKSIRGFKIC